jgi:hypothetical protein
VKLSPSPQSIALSLEISTDGGHQWNQATPPFPGPLSFRVACQPNGRCVAADGENLWHAESFGAHLDVTANLDRNP